jgi:hypothetical protein
MHIGKLLTFFVVTIVGGLLQVWVLWLILAVGLNKPVGLAALLGDGGLFFFSTSITVSSFLLLIDRHSLKVGTADLNVTLVLAGAAALSAVVMYTSVMSANFGSANPFKDLLFPQIACATAAFTYAFYVAVRTGQLKP